MSNTEDQIVDMATKLKALGDPARLRIFQFLRAQCCAVAIEESGDVRPVCGPTVGEVCCSITGVKQINSTVSQQLKELRLAGLITVERSGRNMVCGINEDAIVEIGQFFAPNFLGGSKDGCC